jgi:spore maturation protein CgeB
VTGHGHRTSILYLGEAGWGRLSWSFRRAFESLGCDVHFEDVTGRFETRLLPSGSLPARIAFRALRPILPRLIESRIRQAVRRRRYDLVFTHKPMLLRAAFLQELRDTLAAPLFMFHPDDPLDEHPSRNNANTRAAIAVTDCFFAWARYRMPALLEHGARRVEYLPFAYDPALHHPSFATGGAGEFPAVAFVGSFSEERAEWLDHVADRDLGIWGHLWTGRAARRYPRLRAAVKGPPQPGPAVSRIYARSGIGLNLIQVYPNGHNMRTFEAPASGGFVMSTRTTELLELFAEDREVVCFESPDELRSKVAFYLARPEARARIARAGWERVLTETYAKRAATVLGVLRDAS